MEEENGSGLPQWLKGLVASVTAIVVMLGLTIGLGWEAAVGLAQLVNENFLEHKDLEHRIDSLETEACEAWIQDEGERRRMGAMGSTPRRLQPPWCEKGLK